MVPTVRPRFVHAFRYRGDAADGDRGHRFLSDFRPPVAGSSDTGHTVFYAILDEVCDQGCGRAEKRRTTRRAQRCGATCGFGDFYGRSMHALLEHCVS